MRAALAPIVFVIALACSFTDAHGQQSVWFADDEACPSADFSSAQAAIDAAADGDLVVLRNGAGDEPLVIDGKSVTLVGAGLARPAVGGGVAGVVVRNLAAGQGVTLRGLVLDPRLQVLDCAGSVWVEDCLGGPAAWPLSEPTVRVVESDAVTLLRCELRGSSGAVAGAHALEVDGGRVYAYDCELRGGTHTPGPGPGTDGGHAVRVLGDGFVLLDDGLARGGAGTTSSTCDVGGDGGNALQLQNPGSNAWTLGASLVRGDAGNLGTGCTHGEYGLELGGQGVSNLDALDGPPRGLTAPALAIEGDVIELALDTQPGDQVFLLLSLAALPLRSSAFDGALLPALPGLLLPLGGADGALPVALPPDLAPTGMAVPLVLQALALDGSDKRAGSGSWLTVLDGSLAGELACQATLWVDDDAPADPAPGNPNVSDPLEDGSLAHPFDSIQQALDASGHDTRILVRDGSYSALPAAGLVIGNKRLTVESENGPEHCTIVAEQRGFHLQTEPPEALIRGFTITGASIAALGNSFSTTRVRVERCWLVDNARGVQLNVTSSNDVALEDCLITGSTRLAVEANGGSLRLERCDVRENGTPGAAPATLEVGLLATLVLRDCLVVRNDNAHGTAARIEGDLDCWNSTFALNPDSSNGAELQVLGGGRLDMRHSIVWGGGAAAIHVAAGGLAGLDWSLIRGGASGVSDDPGGNLGVGPGVIDGPPAFKDPANDDFHLGPTSPCLDAGDPAFVPQAGETDIDGQPRVQGGAVDLGADERS